MPNANINLPFNVTKQIRVEGKNADDTAIKPIDTITFSDSSASVTVTATADPNIFDVVNSSNSATGTGTIFWSAHNELGNPVTGQTPFTLMPADPATHIVTTEL